MAVREMSVASRASNRTDLQENDDGSVDLYFGPTAPAGKASNWVQTARKGNFEVICRLYTPTKALSERSWRLPDIEEVH